MQKAAEERAIKTLTEAQKKANYIEYEAKKKADAYWNEVSQRMEKFYSEHKALKALLDFDLDEK